MTVAPLTSAVMGAVDEKDVGVASGINNTAARVSGLLAVAIAGLVVHGTFAGRLAAELDAEAISPAVREAVLAQRSDLADAALPAAATPVERGAVDRASDRAFVAAFRRVCVLSFFLAVLGALAAALTIRAPSAERVAAADAAPDCGHLGQMLDVAPRTPGCEECTRLGQGWVHLRVCLSCGYVGCCDSSRNRHATAHFFATAHPIVRSLEPGESWRWCYVDEAAV
jgi:hypothetical protein